MKIAIGKFLKGKEEYDNENIVCPIQKYDIYKFVRIRLLFRIIFISLYGFGFGYMIAFNKLSIAEIKSNAISFLLFYIITFYLIQIPHEFTHALFYSKPLKNENNTLLFFNKKRLLTSELRENTTSFILCINLVTPFILFTIIPIIIMISYSSFNLLLYSISFANAILSSDDLINIILQFFSPNNNGYKTLFILSNNYFTEERQESNLNNIDLINENITLESNKSFELESENTINEDESTTEDKVDIDNKIDLSDEYDDKNIKLNEI